MNRYKELRDAKQARFNAYMSQYGFYAFSDEQFNKGLEKLNATPGDLSRIPGGGFILSDKANGLRDLLDETSADQAAALADPKTGREFALDMFLYELANHEYTYTLDTSETLDALGYTSEDIKASPQLAEALREAKKILLAQEEEQDTPAL